MLDVQPAIFEDLHYGVCCEAAFGLSREASPRVPGGCMFASRGPVSIVVASPLAKLSYARAPLSHSKYVGFYSGAAGLRVCPPPGTGASPPATRRARSEPLLHPILKRSRSGKTFMVLMQVRKNRYSSHLVRVFIEKGRTVMYSPRITAFYK